MSFLKILIKIEVGVTTKKNINPITSGDTMLPSNKPNLNHNLFNGVKNFELIKPNAKKIIDITNDQTLRSPFLNNG